MVRTWPGRTDLTGLHEALAELAAEAVSVVPGAEVVTVAVRRVNLDRNAEEGILHHLSPERFFLLSNTAGCYSADEAIRYARLGREAGFNDFVKLEVIGDQATLLPDTTGLLEATKVLAKEGFKVLAYTNDDLITAKRLIDAGAAAALGRSLVAPAAELAERRAKMVAMAIRAMAREKLPSSLTRIGRLLNQVIESRSRPVRHP